MHAFMQSHEIATGKGTSEPPSKARRRTYGPMFGQAKGQQLLE